MRILRLERLGAYRSQWDALAGDDDLASPFLRSWWVDNASTADPAILLCVDDDSTVIGGAAFEIDRVGPERAKVERVRCLGQGPLTPDHLDVISARGRRREVLGAVGRWLIDGDRIIDLDGLSERCELPFLLDAQVVSRVAAPFVSLDEDDPVKRLPGRLRSTIKRTSKRLSNDGFEVRRVLPEDADRALQQLLDLHDSRWAEDSSFSRGWAAFATATAEGLRLGEAVIHELADDHRVIASELEFVVGGRASFYQAGRLTDREFRGSGSALKAEIVRWAKESGCHELDLLRGDEPYKSEWATGHRSVVRIRTGVGPRGRAAAAVSAVWASTAPQVIGALDRIGGEDRVSKLRSVLRGLNQ